MNYLKDYIPKGPNVDKPDLAVRMKDNYEKPFSLKLPHRLPVIIRLDGKAFHTFTRGMEKPFDDTFINNMMLTTLELSKQVQTCVFAYSQSDEISLLLHNYKKLTSQPWLNNEVQKIASISAAIASSVFSLAYGRQAVFDSRAFVIPQEEVVNYFIWRQQDATRNSIQATAQSLYSHKELDGINLNDQQELIFRKGVNWNDLPPHKKRGFAVYKFEETLETSREIPVFSQDRNFIEKWLAIEEE